MDVACNVLVQILKSGHKAQFLLFTYFHVEPEAKS